MTQDVRGLFWWGRSWWRGNPTSNPNQAAIWAQPGIAALVCLGRGDKGGAARALAACTSVERALSERALWQHLQSSGGHPFFGTYTVDQGTLTLTITPENSSCPCNSLN